MAARILEIIYHQSRTNRTLKEFRQEQNTHSKDFEKKHAPHFEVSITQSLLVSLQISDNESQEKKLLKYSVIHQVFFVLLLLWCCSVTGPRSAVLARCQGRGPIQQIQDPQLR